MSLVTTPKERVINGLQAMPMGLVTGSGGLPGYGLESLGFNGLRMKTDGAGCTSTLGNEP